MKKTLIAAAAAVALTASAAAEITFGAWLRTLPTFVASNGDDTVAFATNSWGGSARTARLDINAVADDGNVGFSCNYFDPMDGKISDSGSARMWAKPIEQVKLTVGSMSPDNNVGGYRRDFAYGSWNWLRPGTWLTDGEGYLIDGVGDWGAHKTGALIEVFPVEGLNAYVMVPFAADGTTVLAEDTYKQIQIGGNYAIDGVGLVSAVFIGSNEKNAAGDVIKTGTVEAAFELTSVENLFVGAGFKMGIMNEDDYNDKLAADMLEAYNKITDPAKQAEFLAKAPAEYVANKMAVKLAASYQVNEDAKVYANGGFYTYTKDTIDPRFEAGVGVDYNLGDGLTANVDVRYLSAIKITDGDELDNSDHLSFVAGVTKGISSNGLVGLGFQGKTNGNGDKFTWEIPVRVEMWF
jgi:opacity protein-like surface antigen